MDVSLNNPTLLELTSEEDSTFFTQLLEANKLPVSDLYPGVKKFLLLSESKVIGTGGLEIFSNIGLIRSVSVADAYKGKGYGKQISSMLESVAKQLNIQELFLLTDTAKDFFAKLDYQVIERNEVPPSIRETQQFSSICPSSATIMMKKI